MSGAGSESWSGTTYGDRDIRRPSSIPEREQLQDRPFSWQGHQGFQLLGAGHVGEENGLLQRPGDPGAQDGQADLAVVPQAQLVMVAVADLGEGTEGCPAADGGGALRTQHAMQGPPGHSRVR